MSTLKDMSQKIGDLFLVCRQMRYLADAGGDTEAVKAWDKTADALGLAMLATDRVGPCVVCGARTDARCQRCDTLLCTEEHALMYHTSTDKGRECDWRRGLQTSYPEFHPPLGATFPEPTMPTYLGPKREGMDK